MKDFIKYYKPHVGLFILDIVCALMFSACGLVYPVVAKRIINIYVPNLDVRMIWISGAVLLGIFLFKALLNFIIEYWGHMVGVKIQGDMRRDFFAHIEKLPVGFFDETKSGTLLSRLVNDLMDISELAHHGPEDLLISVLTLVGAFVILGRIDMELTAIVFAFVPLMVIYSAILTNKTRNSFKQNRIVTAQINAGVETSIQGIRVSKAFNSESHEEEKFKNSNNDFMKARLVNYNLMARFHTGIGLFGDILYLVVIVISGIYFMKGRINSGEFTEFILYISMILGPINKFASLYEQIQSGASGYRRFREIMDINVENEPENPVKVGRLKGDIVFDNVTFGYEGKRVFDKTSKKKKKKKKEEDTALPPIRNVLKDVSISINAGETVAFVGSSGGGKTTLCHLLPRFYDVENGRITIDGVNINDMALKELRDNIGIVQQDVFIFEGTIKENIAYGRFEATEEEIIEAAKRADIHDFAMSLDNGYETEVGERGIKLSGGQKQRISIARAFLKNPPILILDEATSALDNVTEMQIQTELEKLSEGRTTLMVAHRLSTVRNANKIFVIDGGHVVEQGSHEELMKLDGEYAALYRLQSKKEVKPII